MPPQAVKDWLSYFETIADDLGIEVEVTPGDIFHIRLNTDTQAIAKVRYSEYPNRQEDHIWQRFDQESNQLDKNEGERVFAVQLDVKSSDEFNRRHDHFVLVKEDILREELTPNGDIHINTDQPGKYDPPFDGLADNWNIIFEHATGRTYSHDVSEALGPIPEKYEGADQVRETLFGVLESYEEARKESNWDHPVLQTLKQDIPDAIEQLLVGQYDELEVDHTKLVGNISNVPWVNIFDVRAADSAQQGLYVVYLFDDLAEKVYLTLNQGVKQLRDAHGTPVARTVLESRSEILRNKISLNEFNDGPIEFSDDLITNRNELFQPGTVCYRAYSLDSFPSSTKVATDLIELLGEYRGLVNSGVYEDLEAAFDDQNKIQRNPFNEKEASTRYFWINSASEDWYHEGGTAFYKRTTSSGTNRKNQQVYERLRPGDKILVYRNQPKGAIVGKAHVKLGLHEEPVDGRDGPVEGVTIAWDVPINQVEMSQIAATPEFEETAIVDSGNPYVVTELSEQQYETVLDLSEEREQRVNDLRAKLSPPTISLELPPGLYFESEEELLRQIQASLNSGKHIIFTGPPGTGKTKLAKHISAEAVNQHGDIIDGYQFTTATAEWTTFDTIGGYVPNRTDEGDELIFQPRIFLNCFRSDGTVQNEWLVIDEINRADIDKAFGQLFSVLSGDSVKLPYERDSFIELVALDESEAETDEENLEAIVSDPDIFPITPSWRLLATMNTYDKTSLYELSYAFMRRFNFIHVGVPPIAQDGTIRTSLLRPDAEDNYATAWLAADDSLREPLEASYKQLTVIWSKVNKQQTIGPSIVRDILGYLAASGSATLDDPGPALTDAVIALVFPQLEGMAPKDQRSLVESLTDTDVPTEDGLVDLTLEGDRLERKAEDFFDLPSKSDD